MNRLFCLITCLLLGACQSPNPYRQASLPLPPAPEMATQQPDPSAYPAAPRDYSQYRSWRWEQLPAGHARTTPEEVADAVAAGLDQRGLRPALQDDAADLLVRAQLHQEERLYQRYEDYPYPRYGYGYGYGHHGPHRHARHHHLYGHAPVLHSWREQVLVLRIELLDAASGHSLWVGVAERPLGEHGARGRALHAAVRAALADYPPR